MTARLVRGRIHEVWKSVGGWRKRGQGQPGGSDGTGPEDPISRNQEESGMGLTGRSRGAIGHKRACTTRMVQATVMTASIIACAVATIQPVTADERGTWAQTGAMDVARAAFATTALHDGRILVAGGITVGGVPTTSAEIYDPATGRWTATGSMTMAHIYPVATTLRDGRVLVAGGFSSIGSNNTPLSSAEMYNPTTGTWSPTGSMDVPRTLATIAPLPDGKVLVAGAYESGQNGPFPLASAGVYDPATGTWTPTASMAVARADGSATALPDGSIIVAGGVGTTGQLTSAEVYNPTSSAWSSTGAMIEARAQHAAVALRDGRVLVAGGAAGGAALADAEIYTPSTKAWSGAGAMTTPRADGAATTLADGTVLVVGGISAESNPALTSADIYNPRRGAWSATGSMRDGRTNFGLTALPDGDVLAMGGASGIVGQNITTASTILSSAEIYQGPRAQEAGVGGSTLALALGGLVVIAVGLVVTRRRLLRRPS